MTERKPTGVGFESWVEMQIREAVDRGDFDNLPGAGKPLPGLSGPHDEQWWLKSYLRREGLSTEALLPPPLQLRKEIQRLPDAVRDLPSEQEVRDIVEKLNQRIMDWLRSGSGPQVQVGPVDVESVVEQWRANQSPATQGAATCADNATTEEASAVRAQWWRRIARRTRESS